MNRAERRAAARASRRPARRAGPKRSPVTAAVAQRRTKRAIWRGACSCETAPIQGTTGVCVLSAPICVERGA